jgi:hypothetical protein
VLSSYIITLNCLPPIPARDKNPLNALIILNSKKAGPQEFSMHKPSLFLLK